MLLRCTKNDLVLARHDDDDDDDEDDDDDDDDDNKFEILKP